MSDQTPLDPTPPTEPTSDSKPEPRAGGLDTTEVQEAVIEAIKTCYDPEIPVNIYELGLIYRVDVRSDGHVDVQMTLTSPACPVAGTLPGEVEQKVRSAPGVTSASIELVWDPPWDMEMMSEPARLELGFL